MKFLSYIVIALCSSAFTAFILYGGHFVGPSKSLTSPSFDITYSDFVSFLLTVLAVILTALALVIGLIAFRTFGEIKLEARRIAEEHSKSEVELSLATVPDRVKKAVEQVVSERLPDAIDEAVENAGKAGRLDHALQKAIMQISSGGGATNTELQPDFETQTRKEENDA